jgi:uncharacterized sporulation protein YeaH/YhbH (DUF444 family)
VNALRDAAEYLTRAADLRVQLKRLREEHLFRVRLIDETLRYNPLADRARKRRCGICRQEGHTMRLHRPKTS